MGIARESVSLKNDKRFSCSNNWEKWEIFGKGKLKNNIVHDGNTYLIIPIDFRKKVEIPDFSGMKMKYFTIFQNAKTGCKFSLSGTMDEEYGEKTVLISFRSALA